MAPNANVCSACCADTLIQFGEILDAPVHVGRLFRTREEALRAPTGTIRLAFCLQCGHITNTTFNSELLKYGGEYDNSLEFSPLFRSYASQLAATIVGRYHLHGKKIVEIGCGDGDFLRRLCTLGGNHGLGYDPAAPAEDDGKVTFVRDLFSERQAPLEADFVCCRHMLEHLEQPREFLLMLRGAVSPQACTPLFLEVPNANFVLRDIWNVIYEHCSNFSASSLAALLIGTGFEVVTVETAFGEQFLCAHAKPAAGRNQPDRRGPDAELRQLVETFASRYRARMDYWRSYLGYVAASGKRAVVWGAGAKGTSFLGALGPDCPIEFAVDVNPRKAGRFVPCAGTPIVLPEAMREYLPDVVILMNRIFEPEVRSTLTELGVSAEIVWAAEEFSPGDSERASRHSTSF